MRRIINLTAIECHSDNAFVRIKTVILNSLKGGLCITKCAVHPEIWDTLVSWAFLPPAVGAFGKLITEDGKGILSMVLFGREVHFLSDISARSQESYVDEQHRQIYTHYGDLIVLSETRES